MSNVEVHYGGEVYTVVGQTVDDVQAQITEMLMSGIPGWLTAYDGHGSRNPFRLLIATGIPLSVAMAPSG